MARPRSDIQDRVLAAARARFLAEGVEAASLRNIAKDAETSIGMVYYYYTTKDDLFLAVVEEIYQKFLADLEAVLATRRSYQDRMCGFYARLGAVSETEMDVLRLIVRESLSSNVRRECLMHRFLRGHLPLLLRVMLDGLEAGEIDRSINPVLAMACSLAIGVVPTCMLRFARMHMGCVPDPAVLPAFLREAVSALVAYYPNMDDLAEQLSRIAVHALEPR